MFATDRQDTRGCPRSDWPSVVDVVVRACEEKGDRISHVCASSFLFEASVQRKGKTNQVKHSLFPYSSLYAISPGLLRVGPLILTRLCRCRGVTQAGITPALIFSLKTFFCTPYLCASYHLSTNRYPFFFRFRAHTQETFSLSYRGRPAPHKQQYRGLWASSKFGYRAINDCHPLAQRYILRSMPYPFNFHVCSLSHL